MQYGDPRVLRTQQLLKEALLELLLEGNQLHQLSVQKVTKHAKLNRTTFYLHYKDLEDLQVQMTQEILQQLTVKINALMHEKNSSRQEQVVDLLHYLKERWSIIIALTQQDAVERHLFDLFKELITVRRRNPMKPKRDFYVESDVKTASIIGVIMWWLQHENDLTAQVIAGQIELMNKR